MIIVKLMGGLGNQMFQYAFAQELASIYGEKIVYDLSSFQTDRQRMLALQYLEVDKISDWKDVVPEVDRQKIICKEKRYHVWQRVMRELHGNDRVGEKTFLHYSKKGYYFNFDPYYYELPIADSKYKIAYGYFQGESYFKHCIDKVKNQYRIRSELEITENEQKWLNQIKCNNSVCVHIRTGDYKQLRNKRFDVCTIEYFRRGIEFFKRKLNNPLFFVFTNDTIGTQSICKLPNVFLIHGLHDYQDMRLMMACKHFLISNSTFSWWTSYLSNNSNKIVIVPQKWRLNQEAEPALMISAGINYIKM